MPVITNAGEYLITQQQQAGEPLIIDQMILANITGLDSNTVPSREQSMPAPADVKIIKPITKDGLLNTNTVVYSTVFPSTDGTFDFNYMGLYSSAHDVIVAVAYVPLQTKIKTVGTDVGNVITKNFAIEFNAAADITGINISAESWQIDYTARLLSMDKHQRDLVKNIYGPSTFLNDAFKVKFETDKYYLTAGKAILGGINFDLEADLEIVPGALPQTVWLDVYQETSMMGVLNKHDVVINDGTVLTDYVVGSVEHTLVKLGVVNSSVDIVDSRSLVKRSLELTTKNNDPKNVADLRKYRPEYAGQKLDIDGHTLPGIGGGPFYHDPDDSTSPDNNGTVIVNESGDRWKRKVHIGEYIGVSDFGGLVGQNNSDVLSVVVENCRLVSVDVDCVLSGVELSGLSVAKNIRFDARITMPIGSSYMLQMDNVEGVCVDGNRYANSFVNREGSGAVISIVGSSDYANKSVSISNIEAKGGEGTFMQWSSCDDLEFKNNYIHDGVGTGIYNVNTQLSNSYKSRNIKFDRNYMHDLGVGSDTVSHGISINSWRYIFGVTATNNDIRRVRNNGIEFWANFVRVSGNYVEDSRIAYSYGQCHYLTHSGGNIAHNTVPNTSSTPDSVGGLGIEIGGCTRVVLNDYVIDGYRSGIEATESVISTPQDTIWHDPTAVKYGDSGTLSNADSPSFMRLKTLFGERNLSGSYYVSIGQGVITNYLNYGIHCSADNQYRDTYVINGPRISHGGKYAESTKAAAAAIFISNASASVSNAVVSDATHYGINADHGRLTLGLNNFRNIEGDVVRIVGSGSSLHCPVKQDIQECPVLGSALSDTPTQGTFSESQEWVNHTSSGGGAAQRFVVSDGGTFGTMLSTTADTISGSKIATLSRSVNPVGVVQRGMFIEIVGVSGSFKVIDIGIPVDTGSGWTLEVDLDSNADTTVSGAVVSHHAPTVESVGQNGYRSSVSSAPDFIGQEAISSGQIYKAKGRDISGDWVLLG